MGEEDTLEMSGASPHPPWEGIDDGFTAASLVDDVYVRDGEETSDMEVSIRGRPISKF
jgi:hypothetical protein